MAVERLDKLISKMLVMSRTDAKELIRKGRIKVDGCIIKTSDIKIDAEKCEISFDNNVLTYKEYIYIMLNKPVNTVCSTDDNDTTVIDILPQNLKRTGLFPVGRLDKDTTGLLLITNNGDFAHKVISPDKNIEKKYMAQLAEPLSDEAAQKLMNGVTLLDGTNVNSSSIEVLNKERTQILIGITEGKYHQIKRMLANVSNRVTYLKRLSIGGLCLDEKLEVGKAKELTENELKSIFVH